MSIILNKRGQLKIQQMSFMLVAVAILLGIVFLIYAGMQMTGIRQNFEDTERKTVIGLVSKIASSPELNFEEKPNAVDADKLMVLKNERDYENFWGSPSIKIKGIVVEKIYPSSDVECSESNYPDCGLIKIFTRNPPTQIGNYIALCRKESSEFGSYDKCELAFLTIEYRRLELE
ncbi:MAG: hypothetical protein U9Q06_01625 [Nanoarchaeota archaeon]|nr:hypothetical protein [Nanoarchaeota archaeon]